jgi:hypothetical protein
VTFSISGMGGAPAALHMWVTLFKWEGTAPGQSSFFQQQPDVAVTNGAVTITVPVDAIITLSTVATSEYSPLFVYTYIFTGPYPRPVCVARSMGSVCYLVNSVCASVARRLPNPTPNALSPSPIVCRGWIYSTVRTLQALPRALQRRL